MKDLLEDYYQRLPVLVTAIIKLQNEYSKMILGILDKSVNNLIHESVVILSDDDQANLQKFLNLYKVDLVILEQTNQINEEVDHIFEEAERQLQDEGDISIQETAAGRDKRLSLAGYQKHLEMQATIKDYIKSEISSFVLDLQCHDLIRQMVENISKHYVFLEEIVNNHPKIVTTDSPFDFGIYVAKMSGAFTTERERDIFSKHFLKFGKKLRKGSKKRIETKSDISVILTFVDFLDTYINFYKKMIILVDHNLEDTIRCIGERLSLVIDKIMRLSNFSEASLTSMKNACQALLKIKDTGILESKILTEMANDMRGISEQHMDIANQLNPIVEALQFQDLTQQTFRNWQAILLYFQQALFVREAVDLVGICSGNPPNFKPFGQSILKKTTTKEERHIIKQVFAL